MLRGVRGEVNLGEYIDGTGACDYAAAVAALPASGGTLVAPAGTVIGTLELPAWPKQVHFHGQGVGRTFLQPAAANTPVIRPASSGSSDTHEGNDIGGFSVRPHASASTGAAIELTNAGLVHLHHVGYDNPIATGVAGFAALVDLASTPRCYSNRVSHIKLRATSGPDIIVRCGNGGLGVNYNANANHLDFIRAYACTNITTAIDAGDTTLLTIRDPHLESLNAPGGGDTVGIIVGNGTVVDSCWLEDLDAGISVAAGRSVAARHVLVRNTQLSGAATGVVTIPVGHGPWTIEGQLGALTLVDNGDVGTVYRDGAFHNATNKNAALRLSNQGAGGGDFQLYFPGTGGLTNVGGLSIQDMDTGNYVLHILANALSSALTIGAAGVTLGGATSIGSGGTGIKKISKGISAVDPGSIAATTRGTATMTITGVAVGDIIILNVPSTLEAGLLYCGCYPSAADTVTLLLYNATGSPIDGASIGWPYEWHDLT
jgi:hypothetical protein